MDNELFGAVPQAAWNFPSEESSVSDTARPSPSEASTIPRNGATAPPTAPAASPAEQNEETQNPRRRRVTRKPKARFCRICSDEVEPTLEEGSAGLLSGWLGSEPKYVFPPDEELGRWICPCNCTGTQKWVHEGCLKEWRFHHANNKHFYQCHTCKSKYEFARMSWAERVRSPLLSLVLTLIIFFGSVFLLGFVADPILNLWLDPAGTIVDGLSSVSGGPLERDLFDFDDYEDDDWWDHWLKGFFSLGVVGMFKAFLAMSPWHWWNLRSTGVLGGRARRGTGRDRVQDINFALVIFGALTFIYAVWKGVRRYTQHTLDKISDRVLSVQTEDSEDDYETIVEEEPESRKDQ